MVLGGPDEARWVRPAPRSTLSARILQRIVQPAFPRSRVTGVEPLGGGLRNANFKLRLDSTPKTFALRIYEHEASLCRKELDLFRLVQGEVPVPEVILAEPDGLDDIPPFILTHFVEGLSFRDLVHTEDVQAIAQAARSAGETLAAIGRFTFSRPGWLSPGPTVSAPLLEGADPMPRFVDLCLASTNLKARVPAELCERTHALAWDCAPQLEHLEEAHLVHGDFSRRNLLVRCVAGRWTVVAVLDWEFAVSGSPLGDIGNFLRYECASRPLAEPHFSVGYSGAGGTLPQDWRFYARLVDLVAVCESLTHDELPPAVVGDLIELVRATVEKREPQLMSERH